MTTTMDTWPRGVYESGSGSCVIVDQHAVLINEQVHIYVLASKLLCIICYQYTDKGHFHLDKLGHIGPDGNV